MAARSPRGGDIVTLYPQRLPSSDKVAVLIPCLDEAATIAKVVSDFRRELPGADVWVYDNGSTDDTARLARAAGAKVAVEPRRGKGSVVRQMVRDIDASAYVLVDGDDTYPAESVHDLLDPIARGEADMVVGDRISGGDYAKSRARPGHAFGNELVCSTIAALYGERPRDAMSGYRAMSRAFAETLPILSDGFEVETEMTIHAIDKRWRVAYVPVAYRDRPAGSVSKLSTLADGARVLATVARLFRDYRPLPLFMGISAILAVASVALGAPVVSEWTRTGLVPRLPTAVLATGLACLAATSAVCGLVLSAQAASERRAFELEAIRARRRGGLAGMVGMPVLRYLAILGLLLGIVGLAHFVSTIPDPSWHELLSVPLALASWHAMGRLARRDHDGKGGGRP